MVHNSISLCMKYARLFARVQTAHYVYIIADNCTVQIILLLGAYSLEKSQMKTVFKFLFMTLHHKKGQTGICSSETVSTFHWDIGPHQFACCGQVQFTADKGTDVRSRNHLFKYLNNVRDFLKRGSCSKTNMISLRWTRFILGRETDCNKK